MGKRREGESDEEYRARERGYARTSRDRRREQIRNYKRAYRDSHREQILEYDRAYREKNRERLNENLRRWREKNPERNLEASRRHQARTKAKYGYEKLVTDSIRQLFGTMDLPEELVQLARLRYEMNVALRRKNGYQVRDESARVAGSPVRPNPQDRVGRHDTSQG